MTEVTLVRYLAAVLTVPQMVPLLLILIPDWRHPTRVLVVLALLVEAGIAALSVLIYHIWGLTLTACLVAGYLIPTLCIPVFIYFSKLRDGRLIFILATIGTDACLCNLLASMLVSRSSVLWLVCNLAITLSHALLIWRFCRRPFWRMLSHSQSLWGRMSLVPICICTYLSLVYRHLLGPGGVRIRVLPTLFLALSAVLVYIMLYYFQQTILSQAESQRFSDLLRAEVDSLNRQTELAQRASENIRIFRHDLRHYVSLLRGCLETGDLNSADKVLSSMEENAALSTPWAAIQSYTGSPLLDTALTRAAERAQREAVDFTVQLTLPQQLRVDMTEFAVVVSNALENAITAAAKCAPGARVVRVRDHPCRQQLFLIIANSWTGVLDLDEETGLPRTDVPGHGHGTHSMSLFAKKYDCLLDCSVQNNMFYLRLLL